MLGCPMHNPRKFCPGNHSRKKNDSLENTKKSNGLRPINSWPLKNLKGLGLFPNEILKNQEVGVLKIFPIEAAPWNKPVQTCGHFMLHKETNATCPSFSQKSSSMSNICSGNGWEDSKIHQKSKPQNQKSKHQNQRIKHQNPRSRIQNILITKH